MSDEEGRLIEDVAIARHTGWTLDYVQSLDDVTKERAWRVWTALDRAEAHLQKQASKR